MPYLHTHTLTTHIPLQECSPCFTPRVRWRRGELGGGGWDMTSGNISTYSSLEPGYTYCASISAPHVRMHALYGYRYYCNAGGARNPLLPVLGEYYTLTWKMVREEEHLYILALLSILSTPFFPLTLSPPPTSFFFLSHPLFHSLPSSFPLPGVSSQC